MEEITLLQPERQLELLIKENVYANADSHLIRIALYNFLENAWKFAKPEHSTYIEFGDTKINGQQVFFIKDHGIGFAPEQSKRLFTPFLRLHSHEQHNGSGIGLTVAQRIISRHSGHVWAKSTHGENAVFYFTLPS